MAPPTSPTLSLDPCHYFSAEAYRQTRESCQLDSQNVGSATKKACIESLLNKGAGFTSEFRDQYILRDETGRLSSTHHPYIKQGIELAAVKYNIRPSSMNQDQFRKDRKIIKQSLESLSPGDLQILYCHKLEQIDVKRQRADELWEPCRYIIPYSGHVISGSVEAPSSSSGEIGLCDFRVTPHQVELLHKEIYVDELALMVFVADALEKDTQITKMDDPCSAFTRD